MSNVAIDLAAERGRKARAEAELAELKAQLARSELITRGQFHEAVVDALDHINEKFLALPSAMAPMVFTAATPSEAEAIIHDAIYSALEELADEADEAAAPDEPANDPGGPHAA